MKLKGVKPIEQHFEKIIVAVMGVVFVLVLVMQFVGEPNAVSVGRPPLPVPPDQAYAPAQQRAENLKRAMSEPDPPLPDVSESAIAARFESALTEGVSPEPRLAWAPPKANIEVTETEGVSQGRLFAEVRPPAPHDVTTAVYVSTIDPLFVRELVRRDPENARFFPGQQPYDMPAVSVEASFDGRALQRALEEDPDGDGEYMPLRANWWRNKMAILEVRLEREELTDTGEWTNRTLVPAVPGSFRPTEGIEDSIFSTQQLETLATSIAKSEADRRDIRRPEFPAVIAGPQWRPPTTVATDGVKTDKQIEIEALVKERADLVGDLGRYQTVIDRQRGGEPNPQLLRNKERAEQRLEEIDTRLGELGIDPANPNREDVNQVWIDEIEDAALLSDPAAKLWAHDITAQPGKTYRYRVGVATNNPAFGREPIMDEAQLDFAARHLLIGEMSEWTDPVRVEPMERYFLVSASRGGPGGIPGAGALGGVKATATVFKFYYGFWRRGTVSLEPGDEIVAQVDVPEDLFIFDYDSAPKDDQGELAQEALREPEPDEDGEIEYPEWWIETPRTLPVHIPAQFLDAYEIVGAERAGIGGIRSNRPYEAVLTDGRGRLIRKRPGDERSNPDLKALSDSAKLGETQGRPVAKEQEGPRLPIGRPDPIGDEGTGGGGGGG